ncbi:MAG: anti-sigma-K factor RskA [Cryomorphaceae bacterium]|jgi:anti-sigma-K factor RskA
MDVKAYIESGILEQYALGEVTDQERREVDCLSKIYPEVITALVEAEQDLESIARAGAVKAPAGMKANIIAELANHDQLPTDNASSEVLNNEERSVLPSQTSATWPVVWAVAASITLLLAFWQYVEKGNAEIELAEVKELQNQLLANNEYLRREVEYLTDDVEETFDPSFKKIILDPTENIDAEQFAVLWQQESGKVKISLASLPELPANKQYQLWVLKEGVPSDMGVLPKDFNNVFLLGKLAIEGDAFAITIEPLGGLPDPSLDQLVFYGTV